MSGYAVSREEVISRLKKFNLSPALPATEDQYEIHGEKLAPVVQLARSPTGNPHTSSTGSL